MHIPALHDIHLDMVGMPKTSDVGGMSTGRAGSDGAGTGNTGAVDMEVGGNGGGERVSLCSPIDDFLVGTEVGGKFYGECEVGADWSLCATVPRQRMPLRQFSLAETPTLYDRSCLNVSVLGRAY